MYTNNHSYYLINLKPKFLTLWIYSVITNIYKPSTTVLVYTVRAIIQKIFKLIYDIMQLPLFSATTTIKNNLKKHTKSKQSLRQTPR
jgi:hypothetical protein